MRKHVYFALTALMVAILVVGMPPVFAQEGAGIFKSEEEQLITPDMGFPESEGLYGVYNEDYADNWWYDTYSFGEEGLDPTVRGYYGDEAVWYTGDNYFSGSYDDTWDDDDWFFDTYDDTGNEGFWDF